MGCPLPATRRPGLAAAVGIDRILESDGGSLSFGTVADRVPFWQLWAIAILVSAINAVAEEVAWRAVIQGALIHTGRKWTTAVTVQAASFGPPHLNGRPGGAIGVVLSAAFVFSPEPWRVGRAAFC